MKRAIFKSYKHVIKQAPPLTPAHLKNTIRFLAILNVPPFVLITALLIGYLTMLRQSNLVWTSETVDSNPHVLLFKDVKLDTFKLVVTIRTTQTCTSSKPLTFLC